MVVRKTRKSSKYSLISYLLRLRY